MNIKNITETDIITKNIKQLIIEKLNMSIEEFEKCNIHDLPIYQIYQNGIMHPVYNDEKIELKYKYLLTSSYFIKQYFSKYIKDFEKYCCNCGVDWFNSDFDNDVKNEISMLFINSPKKLIDSIPKKLLDINIIIKNIINVENKIDFSYNKSIYKNGISINITNYNNKNWFYKLLCPWKKLKVSYYGNADDRHNISYTNDSVIITITQLHTKNNYMRYCVGTFGHKIIPKKDYKYIVFRHNHKLY